MNSMFDFNGDGHVDFGEQFTGYQIFEDSVKGSGSSGPHTGFGGRRLDGLEIFIIILAVYGIVNTVCGWLY